MDEKKRSWVRPFSVVRGPFKFFYTAAYEAGEEDGFWTLVSFRIEGHTPVGNYDPREKIQLIKKFGPRAAKVAHKVAEKPVRVARL